MQQELPHGAVCEALCLLGEDCLLPQEEIIVPVAGLTDPTGSRLKRKRILLRQFYAACASLTVTELDGTSLDAAFALERQWQQGADDPQKAFVRRCFRSFEELGLCGVLLRDGDRSLGYAIAAPCGEQGGYILAMRALPTPAGTTAALYRELTLHLKSRLPQLALVNLGYVGGEQEEQSRRSYQTD